MTTEELHELYQRLCAVEDIRRDDLEVLKRLVIKATLDRKEAYRKWKEAKGTWIEAKTL